MSQVKCIHCDRSFDSVWGLEGHHYLPGCNPNREKPSYEDLTKALNAFSQYGNEAPNIVILDNITFVKDKKGNYVEIINEEEIKNESRENQESV